ncbi:MAG: hypothetical protein GY751_04495 [Bacteroidetes bacterium]|nr:hypothetical protein [Bacteroidota bacterium]
MLILKLRENREILTVDCSEPAIFSIHWERFYGKVIRVGIGGPLTAGVFRAPCEESIDGMSWICRPGEILEVEALAPGTFQCQITEVDLDSGQFIVKLRGPDDFLFLFDFESVAA